MSPGQAMVNVPQQERRETVRFYPIQCRGCWHILWLNHAEVLVSKTITNMLLSYGT